MTFLEKYDIPEIDMMWVPEHPHHDYTDCFVLCTLHGNLSILSMAEREKRNGKRRVVFKEKLGSLSGCDGLLLFVGKCIPVY